MMSTEHPQDTACSRNGNVAHQQNMTYSPNGSAAERWQGIERTYTPADVLRLRGSLHIEHTLARAGAELEVAGRALKTGCGRLGARGRAQRTRAGAH